MKWLMLAGVLGAALIAGTLALALDRERQSTASGSDQDPYRGSEPARYELPGFRLRDYDGRVVDATELRGRVVVLTS